MPTSPWRPHEFVLAAGRTVVLDPPKQFRIEAGNAPTKAHTGPGSGLEARLPNGLQLKDESWQDRVP
jgi:hypothetical protein